MSLGERFGVGFRWVVGVVFLWREKGKGGGEWGGDMQRNWQVNVHAFVKTTLLKLTVRECSAYSRLRCSDRHSHCKQRKLPL